MKNILFISIISILIFSCSKDNGGGITTVDCSLVPKSFITDVNPIVQGFCNTAGCHSSGSTNGPGPLTNYNEIFTNRVAIRSAIAAGTMPKTSTLTTAEKNSFLCWIDSGAPNN